MPKVTIVMPVYNGEKYIRDAIESIINQTFKDWEFIIVNEYGSNEATTSILGEFASKDKRIILVQNTERLGISASLNIGLDLAQGEYIARMDSDDISMPLRLEKQVAYLEQHSNIDIVGIKPKIFGEEEWEWKVETGPDFLKSCLLFFTPFVHPTIMIRASRLRQYKLKYNKEYLFTEDYDFFARASEFLAYENMDDPSLFHYRIHKKNATAVGGEKGIKLYRGVTQRLLEQCGLNFNENEIDLLCIHSFPKSKDADLILEHLSELDILLKQIFLNETARKKYGIQALFYTLHCRWMRVLEEMQWEINDERFKAAIERGVFYHTDFYKCKIETCNSDPKVSILIPTFNSEKYIMDTLYSLLEQKFQDFEILIVNELGSNDRTTEIIKLFQDPRIKIIQNTERLGLAQSLNSGIRVAKGEYIARADADDVYPAHRLEKQVEFLDQHPDISVCGSWQRHFGKRDYIHKTVITSEEIKAQTLFICDMCHSTLMIRKKDFIDNNLWYDPNYLSEDFELWSRAVHNLKFYNLPDVLGEYRWDGENITASKMDRLEGEAQRIIARTLKEQLKITIKDDELILLSGWFNPFQDDNRNDRKILIDKGKKLLRLIEKQNELYRVYDSSALKAVLKRRYEWMSNNNLFQVAKRVKERRISYNVIYKKILKRLLMPVYRPFKNRLSNRFDELRRHIWDLDGHMWDYKQEIKAYMDASNPSSQNAVIRNLVEDLAARIQILDHQIKEQGEILKQLQQLPQMIEGGIRNAIESSEQSTKERLNALEENLLQNFDGRIGKAEENLL
ncbi:glycosyltransferase, partial [Paenibacillus hemerocallicola]